MIEVDYDRLSADLEEGSLRQRLEVELVRGFRDIHQSGERIPVASHYAAQIAEIISRGAPGPFGPELAFNVYQEILTACENARATVLGEKAS